MLWKVCEAFKMLKSTELRLLRVRKATFRKLLKTMKPAKWAFKALGNAGFENPRSGLLRCYGKSAK